MQEYLMSKLILSKLPRYHINLENAHLHLARSCMCYISICLKLPQGCVRSRSTSTYASSGGEASPNRNDHLQSLSHPLRDYVLDDAIHHFQHLGKQLKSILHDIRVLERDIQRHPSQWDNMCLTAKVDAHSTAPIWPTSIHDLNLYILVAFASDSLLRVFLRRTALKPKEGTNPLVYAAYFNKYEHARTLLSQGAKVNHQGWETYRYHQVLPIQVALDYHHFAVATLFMEQSSIVPPHIFTNSTTLFMGFRMSYPLTKIFLQTDDFAETANDPANKSTMRLRDILSRLSWNQDVDEQDLIAIIRRFNQVVDDELAFKSDCSASLCSVIEGGYCSAAQYLLTLGNPLHPGIFVSLSHSGRWRKASIFRLLVENGADVLVCTDDGDSVLHMLLSPAKDDNGDTLQSTQLLVAYGCDPLKHNLRGETPLHIAVRRGLVAVAHYLLSVLRARVSSSPDQLLDSLLHDALRSCDDHVVLEVTKMLVGHGCDPLRANFEGKTLLYVAVEEGRVSVVRYLLSKIQAGAPLPADLVLLIKRRLPLRWKKCETARLLVLALLFENGPNALVHTTIGGHVLHDVLVSSNDCDSALGATKLLVAHGCDPHKPDCYGQTPIHIAIRRTFVPVVQYLLSLGVRLPLHPFLVAFQNQTKRLKRLQMGNAVLAMLRLLIGAGADVCAWHPNADSMLHVALQSLAEDDYTLEIVRLLVSHGCDPLEVNSSGQTAFRIAVEHGHVSTARYLNSLGASHCLSPDPFDMLSWCKTPSMFCFLVENVVDARTHTTTGDSMLHIVLRWQMMEECYALEATKVLVTRGCDPFEANSFGQTPFHITFERGYISVAQYLLSLGIPPSTDLLLSAALVTLHAEGPRASVFRCMVEHGVDVHARASTGDSVLHIALRSWCEEGHALEIAKLLIRHGCDPVVANSKGETPLHIALERRHFSVLQYLLSLGISPPPDLLLIALDSRWFLLPHQRASIVRSLVENRADIHIRTSTGDSLLHVASKSFMWNEDYALEVVKLLVDHGCDPLAANPNGQTALHIALECAQVSVARYLLSLGISPTPELLLIALGPRVPLWADGRASFVRCLVDNGADVHVCTSAGDSPLHLAMQSFSEEGYTLETAKYLFSRGCDTQSTNANGQTPIHIAIGRGYISVARYLLRARGATPFPDLLFIALNSRLAARENTSIAIVRDLVQNGANVHVRTAVGDSVLHVALQSLEEDHALETAKLLVGQGCDTRSTSSRGQTPLHIAIERGHVSVVQYLLQICGVSPSPELLFVASNSELTTDQKASIVGCLVENGMEVDTCSISDIQHLSPNASGALHLGRTAVERGVYPRS